MKSLALLLAVTAALVPARASAEDRRLPQAVANDNRTPAGTLDGDVLVLNLRAARALLRPEGETGTAVAVESFGEEGRPLRVPAPLLRVFEGTAVAVSIRNELDSPLRVHGLCAHDGSPCLPLEVAPGETGEVRFVAARAGTYQYWGTTSGMPLPFRAVADTQLSGAFVVDPPGADPDQDRVLVITDWTSLTREQLRNIAAAEDPGVMFLALQPRFSFFVNRLAWPATERFTYPLGADIRWRVVNLSSQVHPMHLHGFYFSVDALGDGSRDQTFAVDARARVVTQVLQPGATMAMTFKAERVGNWLFHCHISEHISPKRRLTEPAGMQHDGDHGGHDALGGMAGLIVGLTVTGPAEAAAPPPARRISLVMRSEADRFGKEPAYGFALEEAGASAPLPVPGPVVALRRGEPVEISLRNLLPEATAIHWHGLELDSYYDGVHGWSGARTRVTPLIEPGATFAVRITPPRTGTFIYHTHLHDERQLTSGLYGALVVTEPGETLDPASDHVLVLGRAGVGDDLPTVVNGEREPKLVWKAATRHRVRLVNITPGDILVVSLATSAGPVTWKPLTKDGAPVPPAQSAARAAVQTIAVGETYDFEYEAPPGRQQLWLEVRTPGGRWRVQGRVIVR